MDMKFCPYCGTARVEATPFCGSCGKPIGGTAPATAAHATAVPAVSAQADGVEEELWRGTPDAVLSPVGARTTKYILTTQRLTVDSGLVGKHNDGIELFRIKDVEVKKSLPQRSRGVGDVVIYSTDQVSPRLKLEAIQKPDEVAALIRQRVYAARQVNRVFMREGI